MIGMGKSDGVLHYLLFGTYAVEFVQPCCKSRLVVKIMLETQMQIHRFMSVINCFS